MARSQIESTATEVTNISPAIDKVAFNFNLLKHVGKSALRRRSPEVYGKALDIIIKSDNLLKDLAYNQKGHLKKMEKFAKKMAMVDFANFANKFIKEQKTMNKVSSIIDERFKEIGKNRPINVAISESIGMSYGNKNSKFDVEDHDEYTNSKVKNILASKNEDVLIETFHKYALLGSVIDKGVDTWKSMFNPGVHYWKTKTESGKKVAENFKIILDRFKTIYEQNMQLLKKLNDSLVDGDPGAYQVALKDRRDGLISYTMMIPNNMKKAWAQFQAVIDHQVELQKQQEEEQESEEASKQQQQEEDDDSKRKLQEELDNYERSKKQVQFGLEKIMPHRIMNTNDPLNESGEHDEALYDVPRNNYKTLRNTQLDATQPDLNYNKTLLDADIGNQDTIYSTKRPGANKDTLVDIPDLEVSKKDKTNNTTKLEPLMDNNKQEQNATKATEYDDIEFHNTADYHKNFLYNLSKYAENGATEKQIAVAMLDYADIIETFDPEYAQELTEIVSNSI